MSESDDDGPGQGLVLEDTLPLRWRAADRDALAAAALHHHEQNEEVLRFIAALEEAPGEFGEEHQPVAQEMARLEVKVNLLLGLVGQLLAVHFPLPPDVPVRLNPLGAEWIAGTGPQPGDTGTVEIWLSPRCPKPLILACRADHAGSAEQGRRYGVQFILMAEPLRERLEKIIFRHHRRSVALSRRLRSEGDGQA